MSPALGLLVLEIPRPPACVELARAPRGEGATPARYRRLPTDREAMVALAGDTAALGQGGRPVLVLYPRPYEVEADQVIRLLRLVLDDAPLAAVATDLPPLAAGVLAGQLAAVADHLELGPGPAVAAVPRLEAQLDVVCWLRTVTGLTTPDPSLRQHLTAWARRRGFEVTPTGAIRSLRADSRPDTLSGRSFHRRAAVMRGRERDLAWLRTTVAGTSPGGAVAVPARVTVTVDAPQAAQKRWFGTRRVGELVVYHDDLDALTDSLSGLPPGSPCRWCRRPVEATSCPFCDHVLVSV